MASVGALRLRLRRRLTLALGRSKHSHLLRINLMQSQPISAYIRVASYLFYIALIIIAYAPSKGGCGVGCTGNMGDVIAILLGAPFLAGAFNITAYLLQKKPSSSFRTIELVLFGTAGLLAGIGLLVGA